MHWTRRIWNPSLRVPLLGVAGALTFVIALADFLTQAYLSIGFLYLFPLLLSAGFLSRWLVCLAGVGCAGLSEAFSGLGGEWLVLRLVLESVAFVSCGLLVNETVRAGDRLWAAREHLQILIDTSPAAILSVDGKGIIELANRAAAELLLAAEGDLLEGQPVAAFVPQLHHALRREGEPQLRASMQCQVRPDQGSEFAAEVWFSTFRENGQPKLAAIVTNISDRELAAATEPEAERKELSAREIEVMKLVLGGLPNKQIAHQLGVSESTVKNVLQQLFGRFDVRTRSQLVRIALERYRDLF